MRVEEIKKDNIPTSFKYRPYLGNDNFGPPETGIAYFKDNWLYIKMDNGKETMAGPKMLNKCPRKDWSLKCQAAMAALGR